MIQSADVILSDEFTDVGVTLPPLTWRLTISFDFFYFLISMEAFILAPALPGSLNSYHDNVANVCNVFVVKNVRVLLI